MKKIIQKILVGSILGLSFSFSSAFAGDEIKEAKTMLYGNYYMKQDKSALELKDFSKIDGEEYGLKGDLWSKDIKTKDGDQKLVIKFNKDKQLVFTTLVNKTSSFKVTDILKKPDTNNRVMMLKGQIKDNLASKEIFYSLSKDVSTDAPLSRYKEDLESLEFALKSIKTPKSYLIKTSFVEELGNGKYKGISRIATCTFEEKEDCSQCQFIEGANISSTCMVFEVHHPVL